LRANPAGGGVVAHGYDGRDVPIYEFRCEHCGARFEELVSAGEAAERCPECGAREPQRVFAAPARPFHLVRTTGEMRKQERKNAQLREATKTRFKEGRRARGRDAASRQAGDG
jgi:putative FmdB family regulatory protein